MEHSHLVCGDTGHPAWCLEIVITGQDARLPHSQDGCAPAALLFNRARWLLTGCALHVLVVERVDRFACLDVFFAERIETLIAKTNRHLPLFARIARKR
jgi:hypothetical protein